MAMKIVAAIAVVAVGWTLGCGSGTSVRSVPSQPARIGQPAITTYTRPEGPGLPVTVPYASFSGVYFEDELEQLRAAIVDRLTAHVTAQVDARWHVIPHDDLKLLAAQAAQGYRWRTAEPCGPPVTADSLLADVFPDRLLVEVNVVCGPSCELQVSVWLGGGEIETFVAALPEGSLAAAIGAAPGLQLTDQPRGRHGFTRIMESHRATRTILGSIRVQARAHSGWTAAPDNTMFEGFGSALEGCAPSLNGSATVRVELTTDGSARRCEPPAGYPAGSDVQCLCRALGTVRFPTGSPGRRVEVNVAGPTPSVGTSDGGRATLMILTNVRGADFRLDELAHCLAEVQLTVDAGGSGYPISWSVDGHGLPTRVEVDWPFSVGQEARGCANGVLKRTRFACPQDAQPAVIAATLVLHPQ